jgi:hypothetical protein
VREHLRTSPKALILSMGNAPLIDSILSNVQPDVLEMLETMGITRKATVSVVKNLQKALIAART